MTSLVPVINAAPLSINTDNNLPTTYDTSIEKRADSFWMANIQRQGTVAFGSSGYQVYRNVMDFGAKGDGVTDDTAAINSAISSGGRCGQGCDSSTTQPALVYFPPGTYIVSSPIIQVSFYPLFPRTMLILRTVLLHPASRLSN
jgi:glucan 1,3-beta-glucosidase